MAYPRPRADNARDGSSTLTSACYVCRSDLPSPKSRRPLERNKKAVSFLDTFVTEFPVPSEQSVRLYNIRKPFSRVDKARRAVEQAETTINMFRTHAGSWWFTFT